MMRINQILFPTDFSEGAERAWRVAIYFAESFEAELLVVHVEAENGRGDSVSATEDDQLIRKVRALAQTDARTRALRVTASDVASGIYHVAREADVDLLTMGTHGRRGVRRLLIGSVAEEIVRTSEWPVLTVRIRDDNLSVVRAIRSILVPIDFSSHARFSLAHAVSLARRTGANLELLHIVEQRAMPRVYDRGAASLSLEKVKTRAREAMETMVHEELGFDRATIHVKSGYASEDIIQWANENDNDLMVISSHGRSDFERMLLGSVTQRVVRLSQCPVLTLKSFGKSLIEGERPDAGWEFGGEMSL